MLRVALIFGLTLTAATPKVRAEDLPIVDVTLRSSSQDYLIGEPALLTVEVRNIATRTIRASGPPGVYTRIFIGRDGQAPSPIDQEGVMFMIAPMPATLEPGKSWTYHLKAMRNYLRTTDNIPRFGLAFPEPGTYTIRVDLPLIHPRLSGDKESLDSKYYVSNSIDVKIKAPVGDDLKVYAAISDDETREFLRNGYSLTGLHELKVKFARLLLDHPQTGYRDSIRTALVKQQSGVLPDCEDCETIRLALGLLDRRYYPDDPRPKFPSNSLRQCHSARSSTPSGNSVKSPCLSRLTS